MDSQEMINLKEDVITAKMFERTGTATGWSRHNIFIFTVINTNVCLAIFVPSIYLYLYLADMNQIVNLTTNNHFPTLYLFTLGQLCLEKAASYI